MSLTRRTIRRLTMARFGFPLVCLLCLPNCFPCLKEPIVYSLTEERASGSFVGNIVSDGGLRDKYDIRALEMLRFALLEPEPAVEGLFGIDETSGLLRVASRIDRDELCPSAETCQLSLDVQVMPLMYFEIIKITINVVDLNDHVPSFPADTLIRALSEASVVGTALSVPLPSDPDSPKFGVHHYKLISSSDTFELQVPEDGESQEDIYLVVARPLDRERQDAYMVQLVAFDGGEPPQWGSVMVNISIIDVNDNTPTFLSDSYETSVAENVPLGTVAIRVTARDSDAGEQGKVAYMFSKKTESAYSDTFRMNETTGEIVTIGNLDYEEQRLYKLSVIARDNSVEALSSQALVTIHVTDENDHPPQIKINPQNASDLLISENYTPNDFVAHISVVDLDDGDNGVFNCSLNSTHFRLLKLYETEFKLITRTGLDREIQDSHTLPIVCSDRGTPPLESKLDLVVNIKDENDNAPVFDAERYEANVTEGAPSGTAVSHISATDADAGDNARITYHLADDTNGRFHIDPETGELLTLSVFDHEKMSQVNLTVWAVDNGAPEHSASVSVVVNILDKDDEPLQFSQAYYVFSIMENNAAAAHVGSVSAEDVDSGKVNYTYAFVATDAIPANPFRLNSTTGEITVGESLDHEARNMYNLTVGVAQAGKSSILATCVVSIIVGDFNDHTPEFMFPNEINYTVFTNNEIFKGDFITQVLVFDHDSGENGRLSFYIKQGNGSEYFSLDKETGIVVAEEDISDVGSVYGLVIAAFDNGAPRVSSEAELDIHVGAPGAALVTVPGGNQTIVIIIGIVCGVIAVILIIVIVIFLKRYCCRRRRNNHKELIVKFSADNPMCAASLTCDDPTDKKSDSFSSRDSGNESTSGKEMGSGSSCSPSSVLEHESDGEECVSGRGSVEENNKPLFLQIPQTESTLLQPPRMDKDSDSGSNTTDSGRGSSSSHTDGYLQIDMTPDPCFYTDGSQWAPSSGLLLQPVSAEELQRQLYGGAVQRSHSYLGAVNPSPLHQYNRARRPASFVYPSSKLANPPHLTTGGHHLYRAPVSGGRIGEHTASFSSNPATEGQLYQPAAHPDAAHLNNCEQSDRFTNKSDEHVIHDVDADVHQFSNSSPYWDVPVFNIQDEDGEPAYTYPVGSLNRRLQKGILAASLVDTNKSPDSPVSRENSSILKDTSDSSNPIERSHSKSSKHGNHVRFNLPGEEVKDKPAPVQVINFSSVPGGSGKRVYLCSEV